MKRITTSLEQFREELLRTGRYQTQASHRAHERAKAGALTTLKFSLGISGVFPKCAIYEPLGKLSIDRWAHFCFSTVHKMLFRKMRLSKMVYHLQGQVEK